MKICFNKGKKKTKKPSKKVKDYFDFFPLTVNLISKNIITFAYPVIILHILFTNTSAFKSIGVPLSITLTVNVQWVARYLYGFFVTFSFNSSVF